MSAYSFGALLDIASIPAPAKILNTAPSCTTKEFPTGPWVARTLPWMYASVDHAMASKLGRSGGDSQRSPT